MTDYRALLKAYMDHVIDCEGDDYIDLYGIDGADFDDEQKKELRQIADELWIDGKNYQAQKARERKQR